jgi:hyperosmotically inducible protein
MMRRTFVVIMAALLFAGASPWAQPVEDKQTIDDIRRALIRLPYYGVFDFMAFQYEKGAVTLSGFLYQTSLKREAVAAVKRVPRVDQVIDKLEELPVSQNDDRIRWRTFDQIYSDPALSRYAAGGGVTRFDRRFDMPRFPGMQPFGTYAIHIIVKGGRTVLIGEVDSEFDKTVAGVRAREVPGTFGVDNELSVASRRGSR